ncbi:MAG: hypothetical protein E7B34_23440, partial [Hafnia alvei]|nr:hypothetical protein [Hafnia alvei]
SASQQICFHETAGVGVREEVASAQPLHSRAFYRVAWPTGLGAHIPVRPQPATSIPAGGSKMHSI